MTTPIAENVSPKPKRAYVPAIGPRLKILLNVVFFLLALLGANSLYLACITLLEWSRQQTYQNQFYLFMFLGHVVLGLVLLVPFLIFGFTHMLTARQRKNKRAIRVGYALLGISLIVLVSGVLLVRIGDVALRDPISRSTVYWLHVGSPLVAAWLYWLHRLVGQKIRWKLGLAYGAIVTVAVGFMVVFHTSDPRKWNMVGPDDGVRYFEPSLARTSSGGFIPAEVLDNNEYCLKCHQDAYEGWFHSAHHFSSFNNPAYLASVRETRKAMLERDGDVQGSRWCAGCHDPVPFFSGAFDDPKFDDVNHPTSQAGITCTSCHAITNVNSTRGNGDYTIEEPLHYPFAFSENDMLQWVNQQLIKAKPTFHKKTFLKDFHKTSEFCSTCHKVHLPKGLNNYKEFLRGQNHYDAWLLSGVSGHGASSFYYPPKAMDNCSKCHMLPQASNDFGAKRLVEGEDQLMIHNHRFAAGNTGLAHLVDMPPEVIEEHRKFMKEVMRVDIFGIKQDGKVDGDLIAPLRPQFPTLEPGKPYLLETVIRTRKMGHHFTQGTVDSNEVWLEVTLKSGDRIVGRSGATDERGEVDRWSHFVNVFMLDKDGNRINRRNPQDIFIPLYNHQIPPGAGQVVHYEFTVPADLKAPLEIEVKLNYRKFDREYMDFVAKETKNEFTHNLPVLLLAQDSITLAVAGGEAPPPAAARDIPEWERWNDYGIGLFLEGKAELKQAEAAFRKVEELGRFDGPLNLSRVFFQEGGREAEAGAALQRAAKFKDPAAPEWVLAWMSGLINREQQRLKEAEENFRSILENVTPERLERGFDFSRDYRVLNMLGQTLFDRSQQIRTADRKEEHDALLRDAATQFHKTLLEDSENVTAHYVLGQIYDRLGETEKAEEHKRLHERYKPDDTAQSRAIRMAREKYPAGNHAAEALVIYPLQRPGAPGLPPLPETTQLERKEATP